MEPYYEAYSCLAKAFNNDEQFQVELGNIVGEHVNASAYVCMCILHISEA